jgi:hypothetical protein
MTVCAFEGHETVALGHRHHRQTAALAFARAIWEEFAQALADLVETDAFSGSVPYTCSDRRAF